MDSPDVHVAHHHWVIVTKSNGDGAYTKWSAGSSWYLYYVGDGMYLMEAQGYNMNDNETTPVYFDEGKGRRMHKYAENKMKADFHTDEAQFYYLETA